MTDKKRVRRLITLDTALNDELIAKSREMGTSVNRLCAMILAWGIPRARGGLSIDTGDNCGPEIIGHDDEP